MTESTPPPPASIELKEPAPGAMPGLSVTEFLTDASLAAMCAELSQLTGLLIQLRDERGRLIVATPAGAEDADPWAIVEASEAGDIPADAERFPLVVESRRIGELVLGPGEPGVSSRAREHLSSALRRLATASAELCADVLELRHRVKELRMLFRLSSLLATRGTTVEQTLEEVLSSSLDVFDLDAGSIVLFPEDQDGVAAMDDERELIVKASSGLSRQWLDSPVPLSEGRVFDRLALDGEVITAADLQKDPRVIEPERCAMERLRSFMTAAMTFRGRPIGVIRLYGREPRQFGASESRLLRSVAEQSAAAVQQARFIVIQRRERRLEHQLRLAGNVQGRMLPERLPRLDGLALAARSVPTRLLGGDFFDMFELDGRVALVIGDVVGKGVPAALLMSAVLATLRAHAEHTGDVSELVGRVNDALVRDSQPNEFTTLWVGLIDPSTGVLTYTGAGHEPPFVVRARGGIVPRMEDVMPLGLGGLAAGVLAGESYPTLEHRLEPGDVLVAHTDGVTDAMSYDGARFGWDRLVGAALEPLATPAPGATVTAQHVLDHVMWSLRRFVGMKQQTDDETMIVARYLGG